MKALPWSSVSSRLSDRGASPLHPRKPFPAGGAISELGLRVLTLVRVAGAQRCQVLTGTWGLFPEASREWAFLLWSVCSCHWGRQSTDVGVLSPPQTWCRAEAAPFATPPAPTELRGA